MSGSLSGKVAIITGASQGLGRAYVRTLARAGATVIATSRSMGIPKPGEAPRANSLYELGQIATAAGEDVHTMICDVGQEDQITRCVDQVLANFGRIDVVINNAATYPEDQPTPHYDPLGFTTGEWERYWRINVVGPYHFIRAVAPHMIAQRSGSIINLTSSAALGADVQAAQYGMLGYATTKAALNRMSKFYAMEFAPHNIAVNAICPGGVITASWRGVPEDMQQEMLATGRSKRPEPEVVGPPILFLAEQTGDTYSGHVLSADEYGISWPAKG